MKKALITIIIIGLVLLVVGKIIMVSTDNENNDISIKHEDNKISPTDNSLTASGDSTIIEREFEGVKNIDLTLGIYSVLIQEDDSIDNVQITAKKPIIMSNGKDIDKLDINYKNGNLTITQEQTKNLFGNMFGLDDYKGELLIRIPVDAKLNKIDIDNGVGKIEINDITLNSLDIDCGTSSVLSSNLKVSDCYISGGTGSVKLYDILVDKIEIDSGTGFVYISGDITREAEIGTGTSTVELELDGKETDYNFEIETGIGGVEINKNKYKKEVDINNNSNRNIDIDVGTGSVKISTK